MVELRKICDKYNLYLIEDSAQSHGSLYNNINTNNYADVSCYSFYPTKNLGAYGDAGALILNNEELYNKARAIRNYGSFVHYENMYTGVNSRLSELQAALLSVKLDHIKEINSEKEKIICG